MTGLLRLGVIPTIAPFLLPQTVQALRTRFPQLRLALREDLTANLLTRLAEGKLDFALIALPFDTVHHIVEPLFDDELLIVGRKGDFDAKARRLELSASLADRLLLLEEGHCLRDHVLYACGRRTGQSAQGIEATSLLTLVQMIESGLGLGLVPRMAVERGFVDSPNLVARSLAHPGPKRTIALVARRSTVRRKEFAMLAEAIRTVGVAGA
jgi:LysR family hydrogen peroxide-inducible transcriptional activator